jgi:BNR repeat-containing family member
MKILDSRSLVLLAAFLTLAAVRPVRAAEEPPNFVAGKLIELNDNGAWSWFMDERVLVDQGKLIVGSVRAVGTFGGNQDDPNWGNVEVSVLDIASGAADRVVFHRHFEQDDHDNPAFLKLPDNRYLAVYSKHTVERKVYSRISEPEDPLAWGPAATFESPGEDRPGFRGTSNNVTYSNLFRFSNGRIYNFYRGFDHDPNYMFSEDDGRTWTYGGRLLKGRDGYAPYLKYAFDGKDTLHFIATEDHPRNYDNSVYHGYLRDGTLHHSDGTPVGKLSESTDTKVAAWDFTKIFAGDPDNVGWVTDLELDREKRPYLAFSVQKDGRGLPRGQGGKDHRYYYGRWDGSAWHVHEMAYAGTRLYPNEDDYTGLVALDPRDPDVVYISTDANPSTGEPLVSSADGQRHHELFRGTSRDSGKSWRWEPITANSTVDNLRPIVPKWDDARTALVWMRGTYKANRGAWTTAVAAMILSPSSPK